MTLPVRSSSSSAADLYSAFLERSIRMEQLERKTVAQLEATLRQGLSKQEMELRGMALYYLEVGEDSLGRSHSGYNVSFCYCTTL